MFVKSALTTLVLVLCAEAQQQQPKAPQAQSPPNQSPGQQNTDSSTTPKPKAVPVGARENHPGVEAGREALLIPPAEGERTKARVIIDTFDYSAVMTSVQALFGTNEDVSKGIRALLVNRLAVAGEVAILERAKVHQVMVEQDRNASNRVKQGTGARIGPISGADVVPVGDVVAFGRENEKSKVDGFGGFGGLYGKNQDAKAVVVISYRLIDPETSEVIATGEVRGVSVRKSRGLVGFGGAWGAKAGGGVDMTSSEFRQTIIGEATEDCVNKLAGILNQQVATWKKPERPVEALVADVSGNTVTIDAGTNDGVNIGKTFEIFKVVREVNDPVTNEVLDRVTDKVGEMTITSVRDKIATGTYVGSTPSVGFQYCPAKDFSRPITYAESVG